MATNYWRKVAKQRVRRRRILQSAAALSLGTAALTLIGCGDDDDSGGDTGGSTGASTGPDEGEPKPGGTIRFGLTSDLTNLEPHVFILAHRDTINQVWDPLTHYDENLKPQAQLAQSWEINPDYTEIVLKLRPGVKYHSGRDFTSADVKFNFDRVRAEGTAFGQLRAMSSLFDSLETPDPMTAVLKSASPRPTVFDFLENFLMGDKDTLSAENKTAAVGTGAFMLGEWRPGDRFNLRKNPNYWQSGKPLIDEQVYRVSLDPQTMVTQLESGELDVAIRPLFRDFARYRDDSDYEAIVHPTPGGYYAIGFNSIASGGTPTVFRDKRVRQALNWALAREFFAETILAETVESYSLPWPESSIAYDEAKVQYYSFDLEKAKSLLSAAGAANLEIGVLLNPDLPELVEFAQAYQNDLSEIDVKLNIEVVETAAFVQRINAQPPNYNGAWFASGSYSNLGAPVTMVNLSNVLFGIVKGGDLDGQAYGVNNTGYYSEKWTNVITELNSETDEGKLKTLYQEMNDVLIDDSYIAFLAPRAHRLALQSKVKGVKSWSATDGFYFTEAWLG